jgi:hypothetical protein
MKAIGCIHEWFSKLMNNKSAMEKGFVIPTIWVDSPELTASYYKSYLGFNKLISCPLKGSVLLKKRNNWLLVKPNITNFEGKRQTLKFYSKDIKEDYSLICDKVRIVIPYTAKSFEKFTIKDCNGIEIEYCAS